MLRARVRLPGARRALRGPAAWLRGAWTAPTNLIGHAAALLVSRGPRRAVRGPAASAWLYPLRPGIGLDWVVAVTLGHVILHRPGLFEGRAGRLILAHELAHTRQHDWLGPFYLPLHILAQTLSALLSIGRPVGHSRVHDRNPLEQTFICLGASAYGPLARGEPAPGGAVDAEAMLRAFGLG